MKMHFNHPGKVGTSGQAKIMVKIKEPGLLKTESTMKPLTRDSISNDRSDREQGIPAQIKDKKKV
jgi:hypothetical protein